MADGATAPGWPADGVLVSPHLNGAGYARLYYTLLTSVAPDGLGGVLIAWSDQRNDAGDVYVQRINANGTFPAGWSQYGIAAGAAAGLQQSPVVVADGAGGALLAWVDDRDADRDEIY